MDLDLTLVCDFMVGGFWSHIAIATFYSQPCDECCVVYRVGREIPAVLGNTRESFHGRERSPVEVTS